MDETHDHPPPPFDDDDSRPLKLGKNLSGSAFATAPSPPAPSAEVSLDSTHAALAAEGSESIQPAEDEPRAAQLPADQYGGPELSNAEEVEAQGAEDNVDMKIASSPDGCTPSDGHIDLSSIKNLEAELAVKKPVVKFELFKTSLCSHYRKKNDCRHGENCRYAHGEEELRARPDGSWDPTSERAKKLAHQQKEESKSSVDFFFEGNDAGLSYKCIVDVPLSWSVEAFKKFLAEQGVTFATAKKRKRFGVGFVGFENEEHIVLAKQILDGKLVCSKTLRVADVLPLAWEKESITGSKQAGEDYVDAADRPRDICDAVTPLAKIPYEDQLKQKKDEISLVLKKLGRHVRKALSPGAPLPAWITDSRDKRLHLADGYRNKCEFTVGCSCDGKRVVGFQLGSFREGITAVEEPSSCRNVSATACFYAATFESFVRSSELPVWNKSTNTGFWRLLMVREGRSACNLNSSGSLDSCVAEVMLVVQVCSTGIEEDVRTKEFERMAQALAIAASSACPPLPLTALLVQDHQGLSNAASPTSPLLSLPIPEVLHGTVVDGKCRDSASYIHEHICSLRFRLSATAFFQVNTLAAEKLYKLVGDWAGLSSDTLVFDVCCGTGTIGLTLAQRAGMVVGIEMNSSAVADARTNADINGITNCLFVCAKAEDVIDSLLEKYLNPESKEQVATGSAKEGSNLSAGETQDTITSKVSGLARDAMSLGATQASGQSGTEAMHDSMDLSSANGSHSKKSQVENESEEIERRTLANVIVIVDPPRAGLHPIVTRVLRTCKKLRRIVYVSCNPETLLANAVELCTPTASQRENKQVNNSSGSWRNVSVVGHARQRVKSMPISEPFSPVKAMAVDLFPHTIHCEMVMLMER